MPEAAGTVPVLSWLPSEVVKSLSLTLGLPTVTSSQAQDPEDIE